MAWNGSGTFLRVQNFVDDRDAGPPDNVIDAESMDSEFNNFKAGIENCLTLDGQTLPTADISLNARKITGLADADAATDALNRQTADGRYAQIANNLSDVTASTARTNLGLGALATLGSPVPLANGGTAAIDAPSARANLGLGSVATENTLPITKGGTGATDAANAINNLGIVSYARPNIIINGDMRVHQRAGTISAPGNGDYTLDRWSWATQGAGTVDISRSTTVAPPGFDTSMKIEVATAVASLAAGDVYVIQQLIEANNVSDVNIGSPDARTLTFSFWIRCNEGAIGTYSVFFQNAPVWDRHYATEFTISAGNMWEKKSVTVPMDTTGTWNNSGVSAGLNVGICFAAGATYQAASADMWGTGADYGTSSQDNGMSDAANEFYITGCKLEVGSSATAHVMEDYAIILQKCQRYYQVYGGSSTECLFSGYQTTGNTIYNTYALPVTMRANPTVVKSGTWSVSNCGQPTFYATTRMLRHEVVISSSGVGTTSPGSADDLVTLDAEI